MVSDDWGWGVPEDDWYNPTDYEWRSREIKAESLPVHEDKNEAEQEGYDITGGHRVNASCDIVNLYCCTLHGSPGRSAHPCYIAI